MVFIPPPRPEKQRRLLDSLYTLNEKAPLAGATISGISNVQAPRRKLLRADSPSLLLLLDRVSLQSRSQRRYHQVLAIVLELVRAVVSDRLARTTNMNGLESWKAGYDRDEVSLQGP